MAIPNFAVFPTSAPPPPPPPPSEMLKKSPNDLSKDATTVLQWIAAHCGIAGNEKAGRLGKERRMKTQPDTSLSYGETKTIIKHRWSLAFRNKTGCYKLERDPFHHLSRVEQIHHLPAAHRTLPMEVTHEENRHRSICTVQLRCS